MTEGHQVPHQEQSARLLLSWTSLTMASSRLLRRGQNEKIPISDCPNCLALEGISQELGGFIEDFRKFGLGSIRHVASLAHRLGKYNVIVPSKEVRLCLMSGMLNLPSRRAYRLRVLENRP
jgi:hypothetical protein